MEPDWSGASAFTSLTVHQVSAGTEHEYVLIKILYHELLAHSAREDLARCCDTGVGPVVNECETQSPELVQRVVVSAGFSSLCLAGHVQVWNQ